MPEPARHRPAVEMYGEQITDGPFKGARVVTDPAERQAIREWIAQKSWLEEELSVHPESPIDSYGDLRWDDDEGSPATFKETAVALAVLIAALVVFVLSAVAAIRWLS